MPPGCGPSTAGRATAAPMVRQRSVRMKPLNLGHSAPAKCDGIGATSDVTRQAFALLAARRAVEVAPARGRVLGAPSPVSPGVEHATYRREGWKSEHGDSMRPPGTDPG